MLEMVPEEILNSFSIRMKIQQWESKLEHRRTPKKHHAAIRAEIERLKTLEADRRAIEEGGKK